jgi:hypothetical protein
LQAGEGDAGRGVIGHAVLWRVVLSDRQTAQRFTAINKQGLTGDKTGL